MEGASADHSHSIHASPAPPPASCNNIVGCAGRSALRDTIHAVQHLIERCMLFYMDREECAACLQRHANLKPAITRIVWDELEKANVEFFAAYSTRLSQRPEHSHQRRRQSYTCSEMMRSRSPS